MSFIRPHPLIRCAAPPSGGASGVGPSASFSAAPAKKGKCPEALPALTVE
jgi:hypothetical protein